MSEIKAASLLHNTAWHIQRERVESIRVEKQVQEKIVLDKLMQQKYFEKLDEITSYKSNAEKIKASAEQGKLLDIWV